jgi:hypothetical protein
MNGVSKSRSETLLRLLNTSVESRTRILEKRESSPGMYTAEYVATVADGKGASSIINTKDKQVATELAPAELDIVEDNSVEVK